MNSLRLVRNFAAAAALAAALPATAAFAQAVPGMKVVDTAGNPVGTVVSVKADALVLKTDRHEVSLPVKSFTPNEGKLLFAMTQAELNAETDKAMAAAAASLVAGADVRGSDGTVAGSIETLDEQTVTLKLASGDLVRLPRNAVAGTPDGPVLGVTVDELKVMASGAAEAGAATETESGGAQ